MPRRAWVIIFGETSGMAVWISRVRRGPSLRICRMVMRHLLASNSIASLDCNARSRKRMASDISTSRPRYGTAAYLKVRRRQAHLLARICLLTCPTKTPEREGVMSVRDPSPRFDDPETEGFNMVVVVRGAPLSV